MATPRASFSPQVTLARGGHTFVSRQAGRLPGHVRQQQLLQWSRIAAHDSEREREQALLRDEEVEVKATLARTAARGPPPRGRAAEPRVCTLPRRSRSFTFTGGARGGAQARRAPLGQRQSELAQAAACRGGTTHWHAGPLAGRQPSQETRERSLGLTPGRIAEQAAELSVQRSSGGHCSSRACSPPARAGRTHERPIFSMEHSHPHPAPSPSRHPTILGPLALPMAASSRADCTPRGG